MTIRVMTVDDIPEVVEIEKECFTRDAWGAYDLHYRIVREGFTMLVAVDKGNVIGYISVSEVMDQQYLDSVGVTEAERGKGIATSLIQKALDPDKTIYLEARESNRRAISLYEKLGFSEYFRRTKYYDYPTEDAVMMVRSPLEKE